MKIKTFVLGLLFCINITVCFVFGYMLEKNPENMLAAPIYATVNGNCYLNNPSERIIENLLEECVKNSEYSFEIRNCMYASEESYEKEILRKKLLLKNVLKPEEYAILDENTRLWEQYANSEHEMINEFVLNHGGTMYYDVAAANHLFLTKSRAKFLYEIYCFHIENIT